LLEIAVSTVGTHCAYSGKDGQAELAWVAWLYTNIEMWKFSQQDF